MIPKLLPLLPLLLALTAPAVAQDVPAAVEDAPSITQLRFSNTGTWDEEGKKQLAAKPVLLVNWREFVEIPPPPASGGPEMEKDLRELHRMEKERDAGDEAKILAERTLAGFTFGDASYETLAEKSPKTKGLLDLASAELNPIVFDLKKRFDRVRPALLDPTLKPSIPAPGHPSYPSGHAAQAYMFAYLFSAIDPRNQPAYFQRASEIAVRREEAGVHFGTDTVAGSELARQVYNELKKQDAYKEQLEAAQLEFWKGELPPELKELEPTPVPAPVPEKSTTEAVPEKEKPAPEEKKKPGILKGFFDKFGKKD